MACVAMALGCTEKISTAPDLGFFQVDPRTIETLIPYEDFVDQVQVFGGYGSSTDVGLGFVAVDFDGLVTPPMPSGPFLSAITTISSSSL